MANRRVSVASAMLVVFLLAVPLRVVIVPAGRFYQWHRLDREIRAMLDPVLSAPPPRDVSPGVWECARFWIGVAYSNICFRVCFKRASERGTVPFCSEDSAKFGTVPGPFETDS